jgi:hypothetical protein
MGSLFVARCSSPWWNLTQKEASRARHSEQRTTNNDARTTNPSSQALTDEATSANSVKILPANASACSMVGASA